LKAAKGPREGNFSKERVKKAEKQWKRPESQWKKRGGYPHEGNINKKGCQGVISTMKKRGGSDSRLKGMNSAESSREGGEII